MRATIAFSPIRTLMCGLLAAGMAEAARAESSTPAQALLDSPFVANLGGFILSSDVTARLNGSSASNPDVDFDQTFGKANDTTRIRADALWRITPTHHVRFMYFDNSIDRSRTVDRNIEWGDYTFQAGANIDSQTKFRIVELAYEYAFVHRPTYEVAGSVGIHYMELSMHLSGLATLKGPNGNVSQATFSTKDNSVPVPLPVIGMRAGWAATPNLYLDVQGQFFRADIGDYNALVTDMRAGATWMFSRNFGIGLGYNRFRTTVDANKPSFDGRVRLGYSGVQLFLTGAF